MFRSMAQSRVDDQRAVNEKFVPKDGNMTDDEHRIFREGTGLITIDSVPDQTPEMAVEEMEMHLDSNSECVLSEVEIGHVLGVSINYPDGRVGAIKHYELDVQGDISVFTAYNFFDGDLANKKLILRYLN